MKINVSVDLEAMQNEWNESIASQIRDSVRMEVNAFIRRAIKEALVAKEKELKKALSTMTGKALLEITEQLKAVK